MGGCGLSKQPHIVASSRHDGGGPSGDRWGGGQFVSGAQRERYCVYSVLLGIAGIVNCFLILPHICTIVYK